MYTFLLHSHSGLRWLILLAVAISIVKSLIGLSSSGSYGKLDKIAATSFNMTMRLQFLIGIVLYLFYSPYTSSFSFNMGDPVTRFWSVEHLTLMLAAIALAEIGGSKAKKAANDKAKFKFQLIFFGISLVLMLAGIPWNRV